MFSDAQIVDEGCSRCKAGKFLNITGQVPYADEKYEIDVYSGHWVADCPGTCAAGKYSDKEGLSSNDQCSDCPAGRYGEERAQPTLREGCKYCPSGYHQSAEGQTLCVECSLGKFTFLEQQTTCAVCAANAFADVTGSKFCSPCPSLTYILDPGANAEDHDSESDCAVSGIVCDAHQRRLEDSCEDCSVGFQVADDQDSCAICPVGQYNDVPGQFCKECVQSSTETTKLCSLLPGATSATAVVDETTRKILRQPTNATNNNADDATVNFVQDDVLNQVVQLEGDCKDNDNYLQNNFVAPSDGIPMEQKRMYYVLLAVAAFTTILSHRCCPLGFKVLDVMFAKSHFIEDSHAMRSYDTRLGASFNLALIIAVAGICLFVWGEPNILTTSTLVPSVQVKQQYNVSGYGQFNISVQTYAPQEMSCADISVPREGYSSGLQCFVSVAEAKAEDVASLLTVCNVNVHCNTKSNFRGLQYIDLKLPDAFQTLKWQVVASRWSPSANAVRIQHTLVPSSMTQLSGTSTQPTVLGFSAVRSVFNDTRLPTNPPRATGSFCLVHGMQLLWRQTNKVETTGGSDSGNHFVQFQIHVEENEYRMTLSNKLTDVNRFSMIITYILSLIGVLKFVKIFIQLIIDKGTVLVYGNYNMHVPHDVADRMAVLEEHLIDHHDNALSMYKQHFETMGGGQLLGWEDRRGRRPSNKKEKSKDLDGNNSGVETTVDVEMVAVNASSDAGKRQKSVGSLNPMVDTRVPAMANPTTPVAAAAAAASDKKQIAALKQSLAKQHHRIESLETMVQELQRCMTASTVGGGGGGASMKKVTKKKKSKVKTATTREKSKNNRKWVALTDPASNKVYYHDENSGDVSWTKPVDGLHVKEKVITV